MKNLINDKIELKDSEFYKLSKFIFDNFGINLPIAKKILLEVRLQKRLRANGLTSFKHYIDYVLSDKGKREVIHMIDQVSTNKTDFFRESAHFDFLNDHVFPQFGHKNETMKVWSSAASSGEEIYTIGICIEEYNELNKTSIDYSILGTDISVEMLSKANQAIYADERTANIPLNIKKRYFLKSIEQKNPTVRVIPRLRKKTTFKRLNLVSPSYDVSDNFDIIFCRNVLIYFDKKTQENVIRKQLSKLKTGGYFFLGHSESVFSFDLPLKQVIPTVYQKI